MFRRPSTYVQRGSDVAADASATTALISPSSSAVKDENGRAKVESRSFFVKFCYRFFCISPQLPESEDEEVITYVRATSVQNHSS
jgi:hypothetical protein